MALASSTLFQPQPLFNTGSTPGKPVQHRADVGVGRVEPRIGFAGAENLGRVLSWMWVSRPMTASYSNLRTEISN
jgi:hypothetical protein